MNAYFGRLNRFGVMVNFSTFIEMIQLKSHNLKHGKNRNVKICNNGRIGKTYLRQMKSAEGKHLRILPNTPLDCRGKPRGNLTHTRTLGTVIIFWGGSAYSVTSETKHYSM